MGCEKNEIVLQCGDKTMTIDIYPLQKMVMGKWEKINDPWYIEVQKFARNILPQRNYCVFDPERGIEVPYNDEVLMRKIRTDDFKLFETERGVECMSLAQYEKIMIKKRLDTEDILLGEILSQKFPHDPEIGITHTVIPNMSKISQHRGDFTFSVPDDRFDEFIELMKIHNARMFEKMDAGVSVVFPALTQKRKKFCSLTIDIDLKYEGLNRKRQFTQKMISEVNGIVIDALLNDFDEKLDFECFQLWRESTYNDEKKNITKDGFHLEYPHIVQSVEYWCYFYERVSPAIDAVFRVIPGLVNESNVFDRVSMTGNWLCYGSAKPGKRPMVVKGDSLNRGRKILKRDKWEKLSTNIDKNVLAENYIYEVDLVEILNVNYGKKICALKPEAMMPITVNAKMDELKQLEKRIEGASESVAFVIGLLGIIGEKHISHSDWAKFSFGLFHYVNLNRKRISEEEIKLLYNAYVDTSILTNGDDGYDLKCDAMWAKYVDNEMPEVARPCTIATLRHYAIVANKDKYMNLIGCDDTMTWPSIQPDVIDYYTNARFQFGEMEVYNTRYIQPLDIEKFDTALVWSHVNTGKTTTVVKLLKDNPSKKVLLVTFRITLAEKLFGDLVKVGFELYNETKGALTHDKIIVQLDSLRRLETFQWDIVILDEINLLLAHMESPLMKKYGEVISNFERVASQADKLIAMDAYMTPRVSVFIKNLGRKDHLRIVDTEYGPRSEISPDRLMVYKNEYVPEEQRRKVLIVNEKETMVSNILDDIRAGRKICIVSMSKKFANVLSEMAISAGANGVLLYTGDTIKSNRSTLRDVDESWRGKQVVIFTQTIVAGVSYSGVEKFDRIFMYCVPETGAWDTVIQMLNRVRDVNLREMMIYVEGGNFAPKHSDYLFSTAKIEEEIVAKVDSQENLMAREVFNRRYFDTRRNRYKYDLKKDWVYWVCIENHRHRNFSDRYFKDIIKKKLLDLGCKIEDVGTIPQVELDQIQTRWREVMTEFRKKEANGIIGAAEITDEQYNDIHRKIQSGQQISEADSNAYRKKFFRDTYKFHDTFDSEIHTKYFEQREARKFMNRCNFHIDEEDIQAYLDEIEKMKKTDANGAYSENNKSTEAVGGAPQRVHVLKGSIDNVEMEKKMFMIEKYMLKDYCERSGEFHIMAVENSETRFVAFLVCLLHLIGFTFNGPCDIAEPNFAAAKLRIMRNNTFFTQYCGGKKYTNGVIDGMTDKQFSRWFNYSLRAKFGLSLATKKNVWYKKFESIPFQLFSKNNILGKTQIVDDAL